MRPSADQRKKGPPTTIPSALGVSCRDRIGSRIPLEEYPTSLHPTVVLRLVSDDLASSWYAGREPADNLRIHIAPRWFGLGA